MKTIRVNAQSSQSGQWCQGEIVGCTSCWEGRIDAVILVDHTGERDMKSGEITWTKSQPFMISEYIAHCDVVGVE
ncbi:hypothetical protein EVB91_181 [Rhizobium phage RHph_I1_18]|nr:hypothetical protein EVB91_181 [Rhizobium phage RHph_I1_18]